MLDSAERTALAAICAVIAGGCTFDLTGEAVPLATDGAVPDGEPVADGSAVDAPIVVGLGCEAPFFEDDFSGALVDADRWDNRAEGGTLADGTLVIEPSAVGTITGVRSATRHDFRDASLAVEVAAAPAPGSAGRAGVWFKLNAESDFVGFDVVGGNLVGYFCSDPGVNTNTNLCPPAAVDERVRGAFDPIAHRFLRLRAAGGTLLWEVSADGAAWSRIGELSTPSLVSDTNIQLSATDEAGALDTRAAFGHVIACR